jgi:hypothetical protein
VTDVIGPASPDNSGRDQAGKFKPGHSGNPHGRPARTRNRDTDAAEKLINSSSTKLLQKAIDIALTGPARDAGAMLRAFMPLVLPALPAQPMRFEFPPLRTAEDALISFDTIAAALAAGELSETEMKALVGFIETFLKALDVSDYAARLRVLEERMEQSK